MLSLARRRIASRQQQHLHRHGIVGSSRAPARASSLSSLSSSWSESESPNQPGYHPWTLGLTISSGSNVRLYSSSAVTNLAAGNDDHTAASASSGSASSSSWWPKFGRTTKEQEEATVAADSNTITASSSSDKNSDNIVPESEPSVEHTLDRLFAENPNSIDDTAAAAAAAADALDDLIVWEPVWYNIADQVCLAVKFIHETSGVEFGWSIVAATVLLRCGLFPLMVLSQRNTSRMAHIQPELKQLQKRYEALGTPSRQDQMQFADNMKTLFQRYNVKPMRAFIAPAVQLPLFMGMFFGIRKISTIYPDDMAQGGMFWFPDLTVPDPLYILPVLSGSTMLIMMEMSRNDMAANSGATGPMMLNFFRLTTILMVPILTQFDAALLCYWTANNTLTMAQTATLKYKPVMDALGIWEKPKPVPGVSDHEAPSITDEIAKLMKRVQGQVTDEQQRLQLHNRSVETKKKSLQMMNAAKQQEQQEQQQQQQARGRTGRTRHRGPSSRTRRVK